MTHCRSENVELRSCWMLGSATFTIVMSSSSMKVPRQTAASVHHFGSLEVRLSVVVAAVTSASCRSLPAARVAGTEGETCLTSVMSCPDLPGYAPVALVAGGDHAHPSGIEGVAQRDGFDGPVRPNPGCAREEVSTRMTRQTVAVEALLTPAEVAALFGVESATVTRWARAGRLTAVRTLGGHRRFLEREVRALLSATAGPFSSSL